MPCAAPAASVRTMSSPTPEGQLAWEQRARGLLQWAALASTRASSPREMLQALLHEVCRVTGWPVGHVLELDDEGQLASTGLWHLDDSEHFRSFRAVSDATRFASGVGLPGRVLLSGAAHWITDIASDDNFPRQREAADIGVRAAFAFPVLVRGATVLVLEFASTEPTEPDLPLLEVMVTMGAQVGWLIERARAEETLRAAEQRLRSVTETANDAIVTADAEGTIVSWNRAAHALLGHAAEQMIGQKLSVIVPERFRAQHEAGLRRMGAGGEPHVIGRTVELSALRRDGHELPVELSLASWLAEDERFYTGILRDISERKRNEAELRTAAERLERSERAAVEASHTKSLFLANMSHELRTPLNAILGFVQLLERDPALTTGQRAHLDVVLRSGEHLLGLINDVLSIARIEAGELTLNPIELELPRLLASIRELFTLRAQAKGVALVFELDASLPAHVHGDDGKLRQVLINLLGNAVKFTAAGEVRLRARWDEGRASFEVSDTGPGISAEDRARLFAPFVQAAAGTRLHEGTGLGLAISRDFVRLMGGDLGVESELGRGSSFAFTVLLPLAASGRAFARRRVIGLQPDEPARRILVVDNADDNRHLLVQIMRSVGFLVDEAPNGFEAVELWREHRHAIVWMDMRMPVMNGYEATRMIRALERELGRPDRTLIIALTASAFEHDRPEILSAGCDEVLTKPFREDTLFDVLARLAGVGFVYEAADQTPPNAEPALSLARLRAVPEPVRAALERTLVDGDDLAAQRIASELAAIDAPLAHELVQLIAEYQFDQLLHLLERAR